MSLTITNSCRRLSLLLTAIALLGVTTSGSVIAATHGNASSSQHSSNSNGYTYGGAPSWLPKATTQVDAPIVATYGKPQMAIPGNQVTVQIPSGTSIITINGPVVPPILNVPVVPATFTFTIAQKIGTLSMNISDFEILDGNGSLIKPLQFADGKKVETLSAGEKRDIKLTVEMGIGMGTMRWAPAEKNLVDWQFVEEND